MPVEINVKDKIEGDDDAKRAVDDYMKTNPKFGSDHEYLNKWKDVGNTGDKIIAFFRKTAAETGSAKGSQAQAENRAPSVQRSDSAAHQAAPRDFAPVSGFARDYRAHAPFPGHLARAERDLSHNAALYRSHVSDLPPPESDRFRLHEVHHAAAFEQDRLERVNTFDYRAGRFGRQSPLRSGSPVHHRRVGVSPMAERHVTTMHAVTHNYQPAFSHYEQHRAQREARDHDEHLKAQAEHEKVHEVAAMSHSIRERLVATFRAEIESHKLNERNFATLRAQIEDLNRRKEAFETSVSILRSDFEAQLASQQGVISSLENELSVLKNQNEDRAKDSVEASEQTSAVRAEITSTEVALRETEGEITNCITMNQSLERDIDMTKQQINDAQEVRSRQQATIYQNNGALVKWDQEVFAQQSRINVLDKERATLIDRTAALDEQLKMRCSQGEDCQARIVQAQADISKLKSTIHGLDLEINNLEKSNNMLTDEQKHKLAKNSAEYNMAHELTTQLQGLEAKFYGMEVEERSKNTDLEAVNYSNQALMDRNLDLKSEYEALQKHSMLLGQQNKDLQRELDQFVETDDVVRRNLDRKEKVGLIREKVDHAMHTSTAVIHRSRSPLRSEYSPSRRTVQVTETVHRSPFGGPMHPVTNTMHYRDYSPAK